MFKYLKLKQENSDLIEKLANAEYKYRHEIDGLKKILEAKGSAMLALERVLKSEIEFFDYESLNPQEQKAYYSDAQAILRNRTFNKEFNNIIGNLIKKAVLGSKNWDDLMFVRSNINGLLMFKERLLEIKVPENNEVESEDSDM